MNIYLSTFHERRRELTAFRAQHPEFFLEISMMGGLINSYLACDSYTSKGRQQADVFYNQIVEQLAGMRHASDKKTPVMFACNEGHTHLFNALIQHGAEIDLNHILTPTDSSDLNSLGTMAAREHKLQSYSYFFNNSSSPVEEEYDLDLSSEMKIGL